MAISLWKNLLQTTKERLLQQRRMSLYNGTHGYEEELIKKKLQQFAGGSINLSKEDNGIGILTLNNPKLMNAFTGISCWDCWFAGVYFLLQLPILVFCLNKMES